MYVIQNLSAEKDQRTVHRNLLMECNDLPKNVFEDASLKEVKYKNKKAGGKKDRNLVEQEEEEDTDDLNIVVFLHEDVTESPLRGGDSVADKRPAADADVDSEELDSVEIEQETPEDAAEHIPDVDDLESDPNTADIEHNNSDVSPQPQRRSTRTSKAAKVFTYKQIGGPPVLVDINR